MRRFSLLLSALSIAAASITALPTLAAQSAPVAARSPDVFAPTMRAIESRLSGDRAKSTVAYVEQFFRLPGNRGFDAAIDSVAKLLDAAGYVREDRANATDRLTYRIESRPMQSPAWTPEDASLTLGNRSAPLLRFATNKNMVAINSYSTPAGGVTAAIVDAGAGSDTAFNRANVRGKIVFVSGNARTAFTGAMRRGAIGVLFAQKLPAYNQQTKNTGAIQFSGVPLDTTAKGWLLFLSASAADTVRRAIDAGAATATVNIRALIEPRPERTIVAEIRGASKPEERFVYSAHVQEPGANDNASGVGLLAEMARVAADMMRAKALDPARTITMLWGDEIRATDRFLKDDAARRAGVKWGMSLDMVGENTAKTGGTFLIEKMPDPSAVWVRGEDQHSEWGGSPLAAKDIWPYWYNDFVRQRCLDRASRAKWVVKSNPFEGGSDHTPFLTAKIPAVLLWHFTDQFYHTDLDRIDMVSSETLANVGACALGSGALLATGSEAIASAALDELTGVAVRAIREQTALSLAAIKTGSDAAKEREIITTWRDYYKAAAARVPDIAITGTSTVLAAQVAASQRAMDVAGDTALRTLMK